MSSSEEEDFDPNQAFLEPKQENQPLLSNSIIHLPLNSNSPVDLEESETEATPSLVLDKRPTTSRQQTFINRNFKRTHINTPMTADPIQLRQKYKHEAISLFTNTSNLDVFLTRLYAFYFGKGFKAILFKEIAQLATIAFIVKFSFFLSWCVDYPLIHEKKHLYQVLVPHCESQFPFWALIVWYTFWIWWFFSLFRLLQNVSSLQEMKQFYNEALEISDQDLQTISWRVVVNRLLEIRDSNRSNSFEIQKLDALNIAARIMRQENYLIALFNKEVVNLKIPWIGSRQMLTSVMEWNVYFCIESFIFERNTLKRSFARENDRKKLVILLKKRIFILGLLNLIASPFILIFMVIDFFFKYSMEFQKNPSLIGSRAYSRFAFWKLREFNELDHLINDRLNRSYRTATFYMDQFPNHALNSLIGFFAFVFGSFCAILTVVALYDQDLLMNFEIFPGVTALFLIGVFGGLYAVLRNMIPVEHLIYDPETLMNRLVIDTHYLPDEWKSRLHSESVKEEFGQLFEYNLVLIYFEIISLVFAPLIMWFSLMECAEKIVDFYSDFTVHVDGLGHVCSFSLFDFKRNGNLKYGGFGPENQRLTSNQGKMEQSFVNFKYHHPEWDPQFMEGSQYLSYLLNRAPLDQSQIYTQGVPLRQYASQTSQNPTFAVFRE